VRPRRLPFLLVEEQEVAKAPRSLASANEMHLRRVPRMLQHGSAIIAGLSLAWGVYFAAHGQ